MKQTSNRKKVEKNKEPEQNIENSTNNNKNLIIASVVAFSLLIINIFFIPETSELIRIELNKKLFYVISVIFSAFVFYGLIAQKYSIYVSKYTFLIVLIFSISISLIPIGKYSNEFYFIFQKLKTIQTYIIFPAIVLGIISIWQHKDKLQETINGLFAKKEINTEKLTVKERFLKPITNLFSKKEIFFTIGLFIVIGITIFTLFYRLDFFDLYSDEATTCQGAAGLYHTGEFKFWDFVKDEIIDIEYKRAIPHQILVALSYKIFGVSTWATRFPSAIFGILLIIFAYFIARRFIKDPLAALLVVFSFSLYFEFVFLQRWGRMYAIIFPLFLYLSYLSYRFLTEPLSLSFNKFKKTSFFNKYLNFNYIVLPLMLIMLVLNMSLHINTTIILAFLFLYIILSTILFKEKKNILFIITGIILIIIIVINPFLFKLSPITFFKVDNSDVYLRFFFGHPFSWETTLIILSIGISILIFAKNKEFSKKYLLLFTIAIFAWILFSFIINFAVSFRYMSFIAPLVIFLIIGIFVLINKTLFNKYIQILLVILLIGSVLVQFQSRYDDLYVKNFASPAKQSVAWRTIIDNYETGEIIYRHWQPMLYFDDIDPTATIYTIGKGKKNKLPLNILLDTLKNYESGWLTWNTHNAHVIYEDVRTYCNIYFDKIAGYGIDSLGVEIFHYTDSLLVDTNIFKQEKLLPMANLSLENNFSFAFLLSIDENTTGSPFTITKDNKELISVYFSPDKPFILQYSYLTATSIKLESPKISSNNLYHIVLFYKKNEQKIGLYIDGQFINDKQLNSTITDIVKFKLNPLFNGQVNDIRIYDIVLNQKQIQVIMSNSNKSETETLISENKEFKTLYHWQKK